MENVEFSKWLITLGVGGILAGFMFMFYRKDVKQFTEQWRGSVELLVGVIKENTASNIKLISLLESVERNQLRKDDINTMVDRRLKESVRWEEWKPEKGDH